MLVAVAALRRPFLLLRGGDEPPSYSPLNLENDPWAYHPGRQGDFESRAAAGHSHVVYVKSPGGIVRHGGAGGALPATTWRRRPPRPASTRT